MFSNKIHEKAHKAFEDGQLQEAIKLYTKALEENPKDCNILSDRAVAYLHTEEREQCLNDFNAAVELQPNYGFRYASRAFARRKFGDLDGAIEDYEKAVELDPEDAIGHNNLGLLLEAKGYQSQADERFKRADSLSKMEDGLLNVIDDLESDATTPSEEKKEEFPKEPEIKAADVKASSTSKEFKKIFTSKKQFDEFMDFIKNGFKTK
jgi:tetratricopeptide (TPR) repeat protein